MENEIEFVVSEWGFRTEFNNFEDAVDYCIENELTDGEEGLLWIYSKDRGLLNEFIKRGDVDHLYMQFKHRDEPNNWIWSDVMEEWEDATEVEDCADEDFEEKKEVREKYIEKKYGKNHGKKPLK